MRGLKNKAKAEAKAKGNYILWKTQIEKISWKQL